MRPDGAKAEPMGRLIALLGRMRQSAATRGTEFTPPEAAVAGYMLGYHDAELGRVPELPKDSKAWMLLVPTQVADEVEKQNEQRTEQQPRKQRPRARS